MAAPTQRWGFHQLDPGWAERLVRAASLPRGALVLDIGAGLGALTAPLVASGARVIAVESHPGRASALRRRFGDRVVVVQADAGDLRLPRRCYHVVANPPFGVTTALLRRLLQPGSRLVAAHLVLQRDAAQRWGSPHAPAAARWRKDFDVRPGIAVPRRAFTPPPRVDARVLHIVRATPERANARRSNALSR